MRSISLGRVGGAVRILLNGHFVFQSGALDQGYWPDGVYTAPTDAALRFDIEAAKRLGYDMLRMHVKVEPDRWYYWADKLGMLVWQDMPNLPIAGAARADCGRARPSSAASSSAIVTQLRIASVDRRVGAVQRGLGPVRSRRRSRGRSSVLDPTRLVDTESGSANCCARDRVAHQRHPRLPISTSGRSRSPPIGERR